MARGNETPYGSNVSVPSVEPSQSGAPVLSVRASPEDFGTQVGQGVEKVGEAAGQVANMYGGLVLETAANQAELGYIKASGDLKAKYMQYKGLQAEAMRPQYEADLQNVQQQFRSNLPIGAQRMFDSNTIRSLGYQTSEYASHAAEQVTQDNISSHQSLMKVAAAKAGDLNVVLDPKRFGDEVIAPIKSGGNALADIYGDTVLATGTNSDTGNYSYQDTPEGKAAEARHLARTNVDLAQAYSNAVKTIVDYKGVPAATDWAEAHKNMMPDAAKVEINQYLAPKAKNEAISQSVADMKNDIATGWANQKYSNVPDSFTNQPQKTPLDVIRQNEGYTGKVGKDSNGYNVLNGINEKSFPAEYTQAKQLLDTQGKAAADKYADDFYQKNIIDKYDIKSLPANTQAIVADGLVNHGTGAFGQSLVDAAKGGATPQQLIDMRRDEYQRLAQNPAYASNLNGWLNRLNRLAVGDSTQGKYANQKEYLEATAQEHIDAAVKSVDDRYGDYYMNQRAERTAKAEISRMIAVANGQLKGDTDTLEKAMGGAFTKGQPVMTQDELKAIPNIKDILDRVQREQPDWFSTIDTRIAKLSHGNLSTNSPNAYDALLTALDTDGGYTREQKIEHLSHRFGSDNPTISISAKDLNDGKPALDLGEDSMKSIHNQMQQIANNGGNIDGLGQQRAVQYYNGVMGAIRANNTKGDSKEDETRVINEYNEKTAVTPPSFLKQMWNKAFGTNQQPQQQKLPVFNSPSDAGFAQLPVGSQFQTADGQIRTKK